MLYVDDFLNYLKFEKRCSVHTQVSYQTDIEQFGIFVRNIFNCNDPGKVNFRMVRKWIIELVDSGNTTRTVNRKLTALKMFYKYLLRQSLVSTSPLDKVVAPKIQKRLPVFVEEKQMNMLIDEMEFGDDLKGQRNKLIIEMFYLTGMRLSELLNLKEIDIDAISLTVKVLGKRSKERLIPISKEFLGHINDYLGTKHKEIVARGEQYIFVNQKGVKLNPKAVYRIINSYLRLVTSIEKKSPHIIRHTFATHMLNNGADLNAIKELLGHANLSATQVYTHNTFEKLTKIYKQAHPRA